MAAPMSVPPLSPDSNRLSAFWKKMTSKGQGGLSPSAPHSEPGLSRDSSVSSGLVRRVSRKVVTGLPRTKTFGRQESEDRKRLEAVLPTPAERRAVSVDRRMQLQRSVSRSSQPLPRASALDSFDDARLTAGKHAALSQTVSTNQSPIDGQRYSSLNRADISGIFRGDDHADEESHAFLDAVSIADTQSINVSQYDAMVRYELEHKWILNLSMHFRDKSRREKFFVTYREKDSVWRRVTISLDYRNAPSDSLEKDLLATKSQRDKSAKIYEAIRESLQDIKFYDTVTNLKLQTAEGRLHVHVVEDVSEIIDFPNVRLVQHMGCRRVRESEIKFDAHMSGFVYKVRVDGQTLIKKEIPGPDTIDEFLYEVNALNSLRFSRGVIGFHGLVVDDDDQAVKGLLISYAEKGALIDIIYESRDRGQEIPWTVREKWARQIVQGLSDIHESGFVQGDFTLSNIVIDDSGNAKIIDINRRGCPVGWEPPEAAPLIDSNQRISMYIGVKSDLYQLGMVLWALATLTDEPENRGRPFHIGSELDVPQWYRVVVNTCLDENPRFRLQATTLLTKFPEMPYDDTHEEQELPSTRIYDGDSFEGYMARENYGLPEIRTVKPRDSWQCESISDAHSTSPSFSDELYYPPRGRSPPRPLLTHDLYPSPYFGGNVTWGKVHDKAPIDDSLPVDEVAIGVSRDLQDTTCFDGMADELDQMVASFRPEAALENEQPQAPGGDSPAHHISLKTVVDPLVAVDRQDENSTLLNESKVFAPIPDPTKSELPAVALDAESLSTSDPPILERARETAETAGITNQDNIINERPRADQTGVTTTDLERGTKPTKKMEPRGVDTQVDNPGAAYTYDRKSDEANGMTTRTAGTTMMTPRGSPSTESSDQVGVSPASGTTRESSPLVCSDRYPYAPQTKPLGDAGVTA